MDYLLKTREETVVPYFTFLKKSGEHLDPKTKNIISVITKVYSQTEGGLRQYLTRALREGVSANEVIDGLLMAFPALGLAKIIWALDIILEMDIPEFHPDLLGKEPQWYEVCSESEMKDGEVVRVDAGIRSLFIYKKGDAIRVFDSRCPHQVNNIPDLALDGIKLTCPKHKWAFDATTGQCIEKGKHPLKEFEAKVENQTLFALW